MHFCRRKDSELYERGRVLWEHYQLNRSFTKNKTKTYEGFNKNTTPNATIEAYTANQIGENIDFHDMNIFIRYYHEIEQVSEYRYRYSISEESRNRNNPKTPETIVVVVFDTAEDGYGDTIHIGVLITY